jgi:raffinose/stachyose/melibiose transport system substrate-binding protein
MFMSIAANFLGGPDGRAKLMQTDGNSQCYNGASVLESFEALANLKQYLPPDAATITSQKSKELFFDGKALMLFGGSWDLQAVREKAEFNWDVMPVPGETSGSTYVIFQPDVGIGINRDSPNQAAAQLFLNWLMSKEAVDLTATNLAGFYPLNKLDASDTDVAKTDQFLNLVQEYPTDIRWMFTEISNEYPRADAIIRGNLYAMFKDDMTPTEAAQNLQNGLGEWYEPAHNCHP